MTTNPVPHADRDHSEQPFTPEQIERLRTALLSNTPTPSTATAGSDPTQGTSRPVSAREVRASEAQVEAAIKGFLTCEECDHLDVLCVCVWQAVADAVLAAGDADEVTRLRAERTPGAWPTPEQFVAEWDALTREQQIAQAERIIDGVQRGSRCFQENHYRRIPDLEAKVARLRAGIREVNLAAAAEGRRRDAAEAEREWLAEVVARVEALADKWVQSIPGQNSVEEEVEGEVIDRIVTDLRAALSGPKPAETPQNGPQPALSREQGTSGQSGEGEALGGAEKGVPGIGDTCCGKCPGGTCYVDGVTGA